MEKAKTPQKRTPDVVYRSAVKPHQLSALIAIRSEKGFHHKLSDAGRVQQPLDAFGVRKKDSFVVVWFPKERKCLAIEPSKWNGARADSPCEFSFYL